jgi:hypothetical protein
VYGRDLRMAMESDAAAPLSGRRSSLGAYYQFWYLRPGTDQGGGGGGAGGPNAEGPCQNFQPIAGGASDSEPCHEVSGGNSETQFTDCGRA